MTRHVEDCGLVGRVLLQVVVFKPSVDKLLAEFNVCKTICEKQLLDMAVGPTSANTAGLLVQIPFELFTVTTQRLNQHCVVDRLVVLKASFIWAHLFGCKFWQRAKLS